MVTDEEFFKRLAGLIKDIDDTIHNSPRPSSFRGQGRIVELIASHEGCAQRKLAALAQVKPGSLTEVLERLEKNQYIVRQRDEHDHRVIRVYLTKRGQGFHRKLVSQRAAFARQLLKDVSFQERLQFVQVVEKIRQQLHEHYGKAMSTTKERTADK